MPQSHIADNPRRREEETQNTNSHKTTGSDLSEIIANQELHQIKQNKNNGSNNKQRINKLDWIDVI